MEKIIYWQDPVTIPVVVDELRRENILISTSDTVFGLLASCSKDSFEKLNKIKGRQEKPYIILIGSRDTLKQLISDDQKLHIENIIRKCWPGPLTLLVRAKSSIPDFMKSKIGIIAVRMPKHEGLQKVLNECPMLFSTSANYSGDPVPHRIEELDPRVKQKVSYIVLDKDEVEKSNLPSTIIDCTEPEIKLVREGAYPFEEIKKFIY